MWTQTGDGSAVEFGLLQNHGAQVCDDVVRQQTLRAGCPPGVAACDQAVGDVIRARKRPDVAFELRNKVNLHWLRYVLWNEIPQSNRQIFRRQGGSDSPPDQAGSAIGAD